MSRRTVVKGMAAAGAALVIPGLVHPQDAQAKLGRKNPERLPMFTQDEALEIINTQMFGLVDKYINSDILESSYADLKKLTTNSDLEFSDGKTIGHSEGALIDLEGSTDPVESQPISTMVVLDPKKNGLSDPYRYVQSMILEIHPSANPLPAFKDSPLQTLVEDRDAIIEFANNILNIPEGIEWQRLQPANMNQDEGKFISGKYVLEDSWQDMTVTVVTGTEKPYLKLEISRRSVNKPIP